MECLIIDLQHFLVTIHGKHGIFLMTKVPVGHKIFCSIKFYWIQWKLNGTAGEITKNNLSSLGA